MNISGYLTDVIIEKYGGYNHVNICMLKMQVFVYTMYLGVCLVFVGTLNNRIGRHNVYTGF